MNDINAVRRIFLLAAAAYLVLAIPHLHAMRPGMAPLRGPSLDEVIAGIREGMDRLAEAQQASGAFLPGG